MAGRTALHVNHLTSYEIIRMVDQYHVICEIRPNVGKTRGTCKAVAILMESHRLFLSLL